MSELEDRINSVLSDPGQMEKITKLAQSLMGAQGGQSDLSPGELFKGPGGGEGAFPDAELLGRIGRMMNAGSAPCSNEQALLSAIQPYLSEKRRSKMERALKIARLARLARFAMGEMDGDRDA